ncbi:hypothetical protein PR048_006949 [Dryococelus australis]|uniref:Uncharacterized protein n=1 Tax=Dryococelus australis TaxID=614101 RepID=A0ABQ9ICD2_9NEOP|nr:hypothetical protein PR048_006949 [Dryococelus australis]
MQGEMHRGREELGSHGLHFGAMTTSLSVLRASLNYEEKGKKPSRETELSMERRQIAGGRGKPGDPRENQPTRVIVPHDSQIRKSGGEPAGNQTQFAMELHLKVRECHGGLATLVGSARTHLGNSHVTRAISEESNADPALQKGRLEKGPEKTLSLTPNSLQVYTCPVLGPACDVTTYILALSEFSGPGREFVAKRKDIVKPAGTRVGGIGGVWGGGSLEPPHRHQRSNDKPRTHIGINVHGDLSLTDHQQCKTQIPRRPIPPPLPATRGQSPSCPHLLSTWGRGGLAVRLLASRPGGPGSIPGGVAPGVPHVGIAWRDAAGRRGFLEDLPFPAALASMVAFLHLLRKHLIRGITPILCSLSSISQDLGVKSRPDISSLRTPLSASDHSQQDNVRLVANPACRPSLGDRVEEESERPQETKYEAERLSPYAQVPNIDSAVKSRGAAVAERLVHSPPTKANRVQSPARSPDLRKWESRWSASILGDLPLPQPPHSGAAPYSPQSPSSALNTSLFRAAQISSSTQSLISYPRAASHPRPSPLATGGPSGWVPLTKTTSFVHCGEAGWVRETPVSLSLTGHTPLPPERKGQLLPARIFWSSPPSTRLEARRKPSGSSHFSCISHGMPLLT